MFNSSIIEVEWRVLLWFYQYYDYELPFILVCSILILHLQVRTLFAAAQITIRLVLSLLLIGPIAQHPWRTSNVSAQLGILSNIWHCGNWEVSTQLWRNDLSSMRLALRLYKTQSLEDTTMDLKGTPSTSRLHFRTMFYSIFSFLWESAQLPQHRHTGGQYQTRLRSGMEYFVFKTLIRKLDERNSHHYTLMAASSLKALSTAGISGCKYIARRSRMSW